jgi:hypothetical protein
MFSSQHSPDGKAYLVGHGAVSPRSIQAWMLGDQIYMARVTPTVAAVNDVSQWEFYAGGGHGDAARWVRGNISAAEPLLDWTNHTGVVTMSYLAGLRKYIMVVSTASVYPFMAGAGHGFDTYFLESGDKKTPPAAPHTRTPPCHPTFSNYHSTALVPSLSWQIITCDIR